MGYPTSNVVTTRTTGSPAGGKCTVYSNSLISIVTKRISAADQNARTAIGLPSRPRHHLKHHGGNGPEGENSLNRVMVAKVRSRGNEVVIELSEQGDQAEPAQPRDELGLAAMPALEARDERSGVDHLALQVSLELKSQGFGRGIASVGILLEAFQADRLQFLGNLRSKLAGGDGSRSSTSTTVSITVSLRNGGSARKQLVEDRARP